MVYFSRKSKQPLIENIRIDFIQDKKNLIISFWASYCKPCKEEMPEIIKLQKKYGTKKDMQLILINVDDNRDTSAKEKADKFLADIGIKYDYLLDSYQKIITRYNPKRKVPATFLVNKKGYFVLKTIGYKKDTIKKLEKAIKRLR